MCAVLLTIAQHFNAGTTMTGNNESRQGRKNRFLVADANRAARSFRPCTGLIFCVGGQIPALKRWASVIKVD